MKTNYLLSFGKYASIFLGLIAAFLLFGIGSNLLPNRPIINHVSKTIVKGDLAEEEHYAFSKVSEYAFDNTTDALILNQALCGGKDDLVKSVLLVPSKVNDSSNMVENLPLVVNGNTEMDEMHYARYWHGSTFLMRLLLIFDDYVRIRKFFNVLSSLLLCVVLVLLARRKGLCFSLIYCFAWASVNVFMMQTSIQYFPILLISLIGTLVVVSSPQKTPNLCVLFFVIGSLTAYFDLLTCPILTWGMPLCTYFIVYLQPSLRLGVKTWGQASVLWVLGYGLTFFSKFVIATIATEENVFAQGMTAVSERTGGFDSISRLDAVLCNLHMINWIYVGAFLLVLLVLALMKFRREGVVNATLCLLSILPPLVWFAVLSNHSYIHRWFVYRDSAVIIMALLSAVALMVDWTKLKNSYLLVRKK